MLKVLDIKKKKLGREDMKKWSQMGFVCTEVPDTKEPLQKIFSVALAGVAPENRISQLCCAERLQSYWNSLLVHRRHPLEFGVPSREYTKASGRHRNCLIVTEERAHQRSTMASRVMSWQALDFSDNSTETFR